MNCTYSGFSLEAGCDEAGRGCLAGPVVAAAVVLTGDRPPGFIRDSKKLNSNERSTAAEWVKENALSWGIGIMSPEEIDAYNILQASFMAMNKALSKLNPTPDFLLIDGNKFITDSKIPFCCIVKGDDLIHSISAASILAKTARDRIMEKLHREFPQYNWYQNKGYPTPEHRRMIQKFGRSVYHRRSFAVKPPPEGLLFK